MPKWIDTQCYTINYGYDVNTKTGGWFSNGTSLTFSTDNKTLQECLSTLIRWCDEKQYVIKSVMPLTTSVAQYDYKYKHNLTDQSGYGYGYGYGVSQNTGFVVLVQMEEEVSVEEYARRSKRQSLKKQEASLKEEVAKYELPVAEDAKRITEIVEKKPLFGGQRFHIGEKEYKSEEEARTEQTILYSQIAANKQALENAQSELSLVQRELEDFGK